MSEMVSPTRTQMKWIDLPDFIAITIAIVIWILYPTYIFFIAMGFIGYGAVRKIFQKRAVKKRQNVQSNTS